MEPFNNEYSEYKKEKVAAFEVYSIKHSTLSICNNRIAIFGQILKQMVFLGSKTVTKFKSRRKIPFYFKLLSFSGD